MRSGHDVMMMTPIGFLDTNSKPLFLIRSEQFLTKVTKHYERPYKKSGLNRFWPVPARRGLFWGTLEQGASDVMITI